MQQPAAYGYGNHKNYKFKALFDWHKTGNTNDVITLIMMFVVVFLFSFDLVTDIIFSKVN